MWHKEGRVSPGLCTSRCNTYLLPAGLHSFASKTMGMLKGEEREPERFRQRREIERDRELYEKKRAVQCTYLQDEPVKMSQQNTFVFHITVLFPRSAALYRCCHDFICHSPICPPLLLQSEFIPFVPPVSDDFVSGLEINLSTIALIPPAFFLPAGFSCRLEVEITREIAGSGGKAC